MSLADDQAILDAINETILATVTGGVAFYTINGRQLNKLPLKELQEMKREYEARVARATDGGGGSNWFGSTFRLPE